MNILSPKSGRLVFKEAELIGESFNSGCEWSSI